MWLPSNEIILLAYHESDLRFESVCDLSDARDSPKINDERIGWILCELL